jgi:predicted ester cyclase
MKRLFVIEVFALVIAFSACKDTGGEQATVNAASNTTTDNRSAELFRINREVTRAIETGDAETIRKHLGTDGVDHGGGPNGTDLKGEDLVKHLASVHNDIDNMKMEILQEAANGEYVFTLMRLTGTTNKPVWGMPANFKIDSKSVDVVRVENMKMKDHWSYMDPAEMMKMMPPTANKTAMK